jgi:hypothetical protein
MVAIVPDFIVWSQEERPALLVVIGGWDVSSPGPDVGWRGGAQRQLIDYMNKTGCRHALIVNRANSLIVRHDPAPASPGGLAEVARLSTATLLGGPEHSPQEDPASANLLDHTVKAWLERLVVEGLGALPDDQATRDAFDPELLQALRGGHVVWEMVRECKRRLASNGPRYTGEQVQAMLQALEAEWARTGGFDEEYMHTFLERWRSEASR